MKSILCSALIACLAYTEASTAGEKMAIYDASQAILQLVGNNKIVVKNGPQSVVPFFTCLRLRAHILNWALASGESLKTGIRAQQGWLSSGENGNIGVYLIDSRRMTLRENLERTLVEFFFMRDNRSELKIDEVTVGNAYWLNNALQRAYDHGGGFIVIQVQQDLKSKKWSCSWNSGHPNQELFDPNAWTFQEKFAHAGLRLFKDLLILDPNKSQDGKVRFHRKTGGKYWVEEKSFVVAKWQKDLIRSLEPEARAKNFVIACAKELRTAEDEKVGPFCFVVDPRVIPGLIPEGQPSAPPMEYTKPPSSSGPSSEPEPSS